MGLVVRAPDKAPMGGGGGWGACGGYPPLLSSSRAAGLCPPITMGSLTYWRFNMDKLKTLLGSLIFMVPVLVLMLAYFDCLVP
jgi:hypothetical protein